MRRLFSWAKYGLIASRVSIAKRADFAAAAGNAIDRARSASPHALSAEGRRFAASKRRNPLGACLALASRSVRCLPIGRHHCALRSRRRPRRTALVTSPFRRGPALAAGRRTRRANAPHRSRSCKRRLNRCLQPRRFRPACGHPAPWLQDVRTYSQTSLRHVREYVRSCPAGLARSASARLRHVGPAALSAPRPAPGTSRFVRGPEPGQTGRKTNA